MDPQLRLNRSSLDQVRHRTVDGHPVALPAYGGMPTRRICHLGVGAFHRAHLAHYLHRLLQAGQDLEWGICGIGIRPADQPVIRALADQDGLYSLWQCDGDTRVVEVIGSLREWVDGVADPALMLAKLSDPGTAIVSLTVTEAGYCLTPDLRLAASHPDIIWDLAHPGQPRSAAGILYYALAARRAAGLGGFTALSCDNLIGNGELLRRSVLEFAARADGQVRDWIEAHVRFPCSMVDRITPAMTPAVRERLARVWEVDDAVPILCEPWTQWVIEDDFPAGRPDFAAVGAIFSDRLRAFEGMKVGLLNGGHSAMAHLGQMLDYALVHEAAADPLVIRWLGAYQDEVESTLEPVPGISLAEYRAALLHRFLNPAIADRLERLALHTRDKFRQALLPPLVHRLRADQPVAALATAVALWMVFLARLDQDEAARATYDDQDKADLVQRATAAIASTQSSAFLESALPVDAAFRVPFAHAVDAQLAGIAQHGIGGHLATVTAHLSGDPA